MPGGVSLPGGVLLAGGLLAGGVSLPGGSSLPGGVLPAGDPPVDRITDTSKNITLATTSLRPVKKRDLNLVGIPAILRN